MDSLQKIGFVSHRRDPQGSNNSAIVSTILELVNVTMRGKLMAAHEKSAPTNGRQKKQTKRKGGRGGAWFLLVYLAEGQTNSVELNIFILKNTSFFCVFFGVLAIYFEAWVFGKILEE